MCPPPTFGHFEAGAINLPPDSVTAFTWSIGTKTMEEMTDLEMFFCSLIPLSKVLTRFMG